MISAGRADYVTWHPAKAWPLGGQRRLGGYSPSKPPILAGGTGGQDLKQ